MDKIKHLFDPQKDIHRTIEKVITYNASQESRLKAEISEYVVTRSIEEQFENLLTKMQAGMEAGGQNEVGVWVSGFYGSGKSSFTKYLGLAFDDQVQVGGTPFIKHLQDRFHKPQTKALLSTVSKRFPAAVVLLDLASEMLAGATMADVSTVLFYKVLQFAGYSRNIKVAAFERKLQKDGRYEEFKQKIKNDLGTDWTAIQNDPLVVDSMIPDIAHEMYPDIFKTPGSFNTETGDFIQFENERVKEMLEIVRDVTGKQHVIFIIDEVGQYIGSRKNLILNMDGLGKNLKQIGDGKVWIISTAQQTLTEDDPRASLNSPDLYKLKDRFPIQIDLESSDIREICYKRILGKSTAGEKMLGGLFEKSGEALRHNTRLQDAKYYDSDFNKETFINLYPFLPAHFDILLHLLGALAKSTGGIGLRSAIKVVQDILIERSHDHPAISEEPVGGLITSVILYDALERDIRRAFLSIHQAVGKAMIRFNDSRIHQDVAKTVAVLQILSNLPVTVQNVASLMHDRINAPSCKDAVETAVSELINDPFVPFGEQDGNLCFFSEKLNDIEQERAQIPLRSIETRRIFNETLKELFTPLPKTLLNTTTTVTSGLKSQTGALIANLAGDRETIQTIVEFSTPGNFDTDHTRLLDESRAQSSCHTIFLLAKEDAEMDAKLGEIYRCREICNRYRNEPDQEVKEYCSGQSERSAKLVNDLQQILKRALTKGSFLFRGKSTAVDNLSQDLLEACKKHLSNVASQVFDRNSESPVRVDTAMAEKFLKAGSLSAITSQIDPLGLVQQTGAIPSINKDHIALISIRDYIDRNGTVDGKRLMEHFSSAPFRWSPDTLRYLMAALLMAGDIKLNVSGREVTVNGQQVIDGLKTNNAFKPVGVSLREGRPSNDVLALAAQRMTELTGDTVVPLEDEISRAAAKHLPRFQSRFGSLGEKLHHLNLPGSDRLESLGREIADVLFTDASDAPARLGAEDAGLYADLNWAGIVHRAFKQGLETTIKELQQHLLEIRSLPEADIPGQLRGGLAEEMDRLKNWMDKDDFYNHVTDFNAALTHIRASVRDAAILMENAQKKKIDEAKDRLRKLPEWSELTQEEQSDVLGKMEDLQMEASQDLSGLKQLINQDFVILSRTSEFQNKIVQKGRERRRQRLENERQQKKDGGKTRISCTFIIPSAVNSVAQLNELIQRLDNLKNELAEDQDIEVIIHIEDQ
jgi:hypothetical protein